MTRPWLRLYRAAAHAPKLQRLGLEAVGFWANCLCLSDEEGYVPDCESLAWTMRIDNDAARRLVDRLIEARLIVRAGNRLRLHDFQTHQCASDTDRSAAERKRRQRAREKGVTRDVTDLSRVTSRTRHGRVTGLDKIREEKNRGSDTQLQTVEPLSESARARWPAAAVVPADWLGEAQDQRRRLGLPDMPLTTAAAMFANFYRADGQARTPTEWRAKWINWALKEQPDARPKSRDTSGDTLRSIAGDIAAAAGRKHDPL